MIKIAQRGFSLPEVLVALFIFSTLAAVGVYALRLSVDARDQLVMADDRLKEFETARAIIREDMAQIALRPVRDSFGASAGPAFQGGSFLAQNPRRISEERLLTFVRRGWTNPEWSAPRSSLQYVEYVLLDNALIRRVRPYLDDARNQDRLDRTLLSDVSSLRVTFLLGEVSGRLDWVGGWPQSASSTSAPTAIDMAIETQRFGKLHHLFWIGDVDPFGEPEND